MNIFYIYRHIRKDNRTPFYVGKGHGKRAFSIFKRNPYWKNIVKFGYEVQILVSGLSEKEAFKKEVEFISMYKKIGYCEANLCDGGRGSTGHKWSEESRRKFSNSKKTLYSKEENIEKLRLAKLKSIQEDPSQVIRQRESLLKYYKNEDNRNKNSKSRGGREFVATDSNNKEVWRGINQNLCAESLGVFQSNIGKCLIGERKTSGGYSFKYIEAEQD